MEMVQLIPTSALSHARGLNMRTDLTAVRAFARAWASGSGSFISHYLHKINIEKYSYNTWLVITTELK